MTTDSYALAIDLGAESGRVLSGVLHAGVLTIRELHRFPNEPVRYGGGLHWDAPRLWLEIQKGLATASATGARYSSIGVDAWGLDHALIGERGNLLENPYHYRDARTDGMMDRVCAIVPAEEIYSRTGIQFMQINTLYQLYAASCATPNLLRSAETLVTIPDLFNYWLTGAIACEFTNATTTQFFDLVNHSWARDLLERLNIPARLLPPIIEPGRVLGCLLPDVAQETGIGQVPVVAPACHDTGSAVAAIAPYGRSAFISSGTWSLLGAEVTEPVITASAHRMNFTNEGGVGGTTRLLKNISGMWLLQSCRRQWQREGKSFKYADLVELAGAEPPLRSLIDPDHPSFLRAENMPEAIALFCERTDQPAPESPAACTRAVLESLALKYKLVLDSLQQLTRVCYEAIRIVGGGSRNRLLNQFTAEAAGIPVLAGPVEATALGNIGVQLWTTGRVPSLREARAVIDRSFPLERFEPRDPEPWRAAYARFRLYCTP